MFINLNEKTEKKNLKPYNVKDLLSKDNDLKSLKSWDYRYFCWSLASYFSNYLLTNNNFDVTYIDSDIFFHQDIRILLDEIGTNEIGIFRHRQFPLSNERPEGFYNVGVVHFKNKELTIQNVPIQFVPKIIRKRTKQFKR